MHTPHKRSSDSSRSVFGLFHYLTFLILLTKVSVLRWTAFREFAPRGILIAYFFRWPGKFAPSPASGCVHRTLGGLQGTLC